MRKQKEKLKKHFLTKVMLKGKQFITGHFCKTLINKQTKSYLEPVIEFFIILFFFPKYLKLLVFNRNRGFFCSLSQSGANGDASVDKSLPTVYCYPTVACDRCWSAESQAWYFPQCSVHMPNNGSPDCRRVCPWHFCVSGLLGSEEDITVIAKQREKDHRTKEILPYWFWK